MMFMLLGPVFNPWILVPTRIPPKTYFLVAIMSTRMSYHSLLHMDLGIFHSGKRDSCSQADKRHSGMDGEAECYSCIVISRWCWPSKAEQDVSQIKSLNHQKLNPPPMTKCVYMWMFCFVLCFVFFVLYFLFISGCGVKVLFLVCSLGLWRVCRPS